jgi:intracellular sulfur oxidation DsrE/DsrF family protein
MMRLFETVVLGIILAMFGSACSVSAQTFSQDQASNPPVAPEDQASSPPTIYLTIPTEHGLYILPFVIVRTLHKHRKVRHPVTLRPAAKAQKRYPLASSKPAATARKVRQLATSRTIPKAHKAPRLATAAVTHKEMPPRSQTARQLASSETAKKKTAAKEQRTHHRVITKATPNSQHLDHLTTSKVPSKAQEAVPKESFEDQTLAPKEVAPNKAVPPSATTASREEAVPETTPIQEQQNHRFAIEVNQNDPAAMNLALDNAENVIKHYNERGESVQVEIVAYGPGLHMLREDTSPVRDRIKRLQEDTPPAITFSASSDTRAQMEKSEGKPIPIVPQATMVPSGIGRLMELQRQGWSYVQP